MKVKDMIQLNNVKREQLNEPNLAYYEEMMLYIRLSSSKSEQHTEEILLELLEHLLEAQKEGKIAEEVFGKNPKAYCQELIAEIPSETRKEQIKFAGYISLQFLAIVSFINGIVGFGLHYFFQFGNGLSTFYLGSGIAIVLIDLIILYLFIIGALKWLKSAAFKPAKKKNKWIEFIQMWLVCTLSIGLFMLVIYLMPEFGRSVSIPTIAFAGIGVILYLLSLLIKKYL